MNTYVFKYKRSNLTLAPLPSPLTLKFKPRKGTEKTLYMNETQVEKVISKSKPLFFLFLVESNTSDEVKSYTLLLNHS